VLFYGVVWTAFGSVLVILFAEAVSRYGYQRVQEFVRVDELPRPDVVEIRDITYAYAVDGRSYSRSERAGEFARSGLCGGAGSWSLGTARVDSIWIFVSRWNSYSTHFEARSIRLLGILIVARWAAFCILVVSIPLLGPRGGPDPDCSTRRVARTA
jgi:hypothetical protein